VTVALPPGAVVWQEAPGRYAPAAVRPDGTHDAPFNRDLLITDRSPTGGDPEAPSWRVGDGTALPAIRRGHILVVRRGPSLSDYARLESRVELVCEGYARVHVRHEHYTTIANPVPLVAGPPVGLYHLVRERPPGGPWRRVRPTHPVPAAWALAAALDPVEAPF
jgi:hypothetical protein